MNLQSVKFEYEFDQCINKYLIKIQDIFFANNKDIMTITFDCISISVDGGFQRSNLDMISGDFFFFC